MAKIYGQCDAYCKYEVLTKKNFIKLEGTVTASSGSSIEAKDIATFNGMGYIVVGAMMKETPIGGLVTTSENYQMGYSLPIPNSEGITLGVPSVELVEDEAYGGSTTVRINLQQRSTSITYGYRVLLLDTNDCGTMYDVTD